MTANNLHHKAPPNRSIHVITWIVAACMAVGVFPGSSHAQSTASVEVSMLPVASVVGAASVAGAAVSAVVAVPVALSVGGAVLSVVAIEMVEGGAVYLLERPSDGARARVLVPSAANERALLSVGMVVAVSLISAGTLLSSAGNVLAFLPSQTSRKLLHNERLG